MYAGGASYWTRQLYSGSSVLLRSAVHRLGINVLEGQPVSAWNAGIASRCIHGSNVNMSESKQSNKNSVENEGFNVENLDKESKEKLQDLKNLLLKNSYYEKYKTKIVKAQRSYPMEFLALLEGLKTSKTKSVTSDYVPKMSASQTKKRSLEEVMKVELLKELEREDVTYIWHEHHRKNGLVAACMADVVFQRLLARAELCNTFVLPLARKSGHDFHVVQYSNNSFYFTPLVSWQAYKENSPVTLTLSYYEELKADKDIVLMRGEFDKNNFTPEEAQSLAVQLHLYYAEPDFARNNLMEKFVSDPAEFVHTDLIKELERMEVEHKELFGNMSLENNNSETENDNKSKP